MGKSLEIKMLGPYLEISYLFFVKSAYAKEYVHVNGKICWLSQYACHMAVKCVRQIMLFVCFIQDSSVCLPELCKCLNLFEKIKIPIFGEKGIHLIRNRLWETILCTKVKLTITIEILLHTF